MDSELSKQTNDNAIINNFNNSDKNLHEINEQVTCLVTEMLKSIENTGIGPSILLNDENLQHIQICHKSNNFLTINQIDEKENSCEFVKVPTDDFQKDNNSVITDYNDKSFTNKQDSDDTTVYSTDEELQEVMQITGTQCSDDVEKSQEECTVTFISGTEDKNQSSEVDEPNSSNNYNWTNLKLVSIATKEFHPTKLCENFTKGCYWSPDGTCLLVPSEDFRIRILELPQHLHSEKFEQKLIPSSFESVLKVKEGGTIYDTCWYPFMNSWDPISCCFLSASQESPIHLWDAFNGELRATYRAYNLVDEVEAAVSVQFTDNGSQVWSGYKNALRNFDINRPGRQINNIFLKKDFPNVSGIVSCIRENPAMHGLLAFGTYSKNIGLYKDGPLCSFKTTNGVTQIEFSPCGTKLFSAVRRGSEFLCWDLRNPGTVLYSFQNRQADTNQRINFCSSNMNEMVSGGIDGCVRVWKIPSDIEDYIELDPIYKIKMTKDCINGVSLHNRLPILAVSTGQRILEESEHIMRDNSIRLYWLKKIKNS